jgi:hypothetical protein
MTLRIRIATLVGAAALALAASAAAYANGAEFFEAENDGKVVLYYSGQVKDSKGNVLDKLMVTIAVKNVGMNFPFRNDAPGHFRSPDIGKAIQGLGKAVDPAQIEITITKAGYKTVRAPKVPNKLGAVALENFVLDPVAAK